MRPRSSSFVGPRPRPEEEAKVLQAFQITRLETLMLKLKVEVLIID
jgi:hypothetical protein